MAEYTRLGRKNMATLLARYDLGPLKEVRPMEGGQANSSYRLTTPKGRFTLSVCDEKTHEEMALLARVLDRLNAYRFPTTRLVRTRAGEDMVSLGAKPVYVKVYLEGAPCRDLDLSMLEQVGRAMACLHDIPAPQGLSPAFSYGLNQFSQVLDTNITHPFIAWLQKKISFLNANLDLSMARGLIHGDIFWDNLLFDGKTLTAIIDFEEACNFYLLYDLGMACVGCCGGGKGLDPEKISALITGYQEKRPLSEPERIQFRHFLAYAATAAAFWRFRQYNIRYPDPDKAENYKELAAMADQALDDLPLF